MKDSDKTCQLMDMEGASLKSLLPWKMLILGDSHLVSQKPGREAPRETFLKQLNNLTRALDCRKLSDLWLAVRKGQQGSSWELRINPLTSH